MTVDQPALNQTQSNPNLVLYRLYDLSSVLCIIITGRKQENEKTENVYLCEVDFGKEEFSLCIISKGRGGFIVQLHHCIHCNNCTDDKSDKRDRFEFVGHIRA